MDLSLPPASHEWNSNIYYRIYSIVSRKHQQRHTGHHHSPFCNWIKNISKANCHRNDVDFFFLSQPLTSCWLWKTGNVIRGGWRLVARHRRKECIDLLLLQPLESLTTALIWFHGCPVQIAGITKCYSSINLLNLNPDSAYQYTRPD